MKSNYSTSVSLACPTCGGEDFDFNADKSFVKCNSCGREYPGGEQELAQCNEQRIQDAVSRVGDQVVSDFKAQLKKAFRNSKHIKFK